MCPLFYEEKEHYHNTRFSLKDMKKLLKKISGISIYYIKDGVRHDGAHENISGDMSGISGNVSGISGNVNDIYGDVSGICGNVNDIYGNVNGIYGNVSGISGNVDGCEITNAEREKGIDIVELIG